MENTLGAAEALTLERLVLERERRHVTATSRSRWAELEAAGLAPARRTLGNRSAWLLSELLEWVRSRPVGRVGAPKAALEARGIYAPSPEPGAAA